jgi:TolA-binding protein
VPTTTQQPLPEQEVAALENYHKNLTAEKTDLEQELADVQSRIEDLKTKIAKK